MALPAWDETQTLVLSVKMGFGVGSGGQAQSPGLAGHRSGCVGSGTVRLDGSSEGGRDDGLVVGGQVDEGGMPSPPAYFATCKVPNQWQLSWIMPLEVEQSH